METIIYIAKSIRLPVRRLKVLKCLYRSSFEFICVTKMVIASSEDDLRWSVGQRPPVAVGMYLLWNKVRLMADLWAGDYVSPPYPPQPNSLPINLP